METMSGIKGWWRSVTIWFGNVAAIGGAVLQELSNSSEDIRSALGEYGGAIVAGIGVTALILRLRTKSAIKGTKAGKKAQATWESNNE